MRYADVAEPDVRENAGFARRFQARAHGPAPLHCALGKMMHALFANLAWRLDVLPPWRMSDCGHCLQFTLPDCIGALSVGWAQKIAGQVSDTELNAKLREECIEVDDVQRATCGQFTGYAANYVDWHAGRYWKVWLLACRQDVLHVTYTCEQGQESFEADRVQELLATLVWKG